MNFHNKYLKYKNKYINLKNNMKGGNDMSNNNITLCLFKADWCGHCLKFKNVWDNLVKENEYNISYKIFDSKIDKEDIETYEISGYPTIIMIRNNDNETIATEYKGNRDKESLLEFIKTYLTV